MELTVSVGIEPVPGYRFIRKLGQGGYGEVWEAEAPGGVHVAIKVIRLESERSRPEIRALELIRNIRHPHLLDVQFSVEVGDCLLIAMPLCDRTLWDRFKECRDGGEPGIPPDELIGYMQELAKAVDFLNGSRHLTSEGYRIGIQHRDIKPHNIFLVGGCTRLADFGLAKVLGVGFASHTGSMSPDYVAPEALEGKVACQSDQYSLAVTYYQLRCGKLPISGRSFFEVIYNRTIREADVSGLPEAERPILRRALAKEPGDRFPSCHAFVTNLSRAIRGSGAVANGIEWGVQETLCDAENAPTSSITHHAFKEEGFPRPEDSLSILTVSEQDLPPSTSVEPRPSSTGETRILVSTTANAPEPATEAMAAGPSAGRKHGRAVLAGAALVALTVISVVAYFLANPESRDTSNPVTVGTGPEPDSLPPKSNTADTDNPRRIGHSPPSDSPTSVAPEDRRPFRSELDVLTAVRDHLRKTKEADRKFQRYFTFLTLSNRRALASDVLMLDRAALAKLVNSLSREPAVVAPQVVGDGGIVLSIDLRSLGWAENDLWGEVLKRYPYGLVHGGRNDPLRELYEEVRDLCGEDLPYVRADWFVATASRPPLYHELLRLPGHPRDLEARLQVDPKADFLPIGALAGRYASDLGIEDLASELGVEDVGTLESRIRSMSRFHELGLEAILSGKAIPRDLLEQKFDMISIGLNLGTPYRNL